MNDKLINTDIEAGDIISYTGPDRYGYTVHLTADVEDGKACGTIIGTGTPQLPKGKRIRFTPYAEDVCVIDEAEIVTKRLEVNAKQRGHRFYPTKAELAKARGLYAWEDEGSIDEATVIAHYFGPNSDHWIVDYGTGTDTGLAYGFARLASYPDGAEWGPVSLVEMEQVTVSGIYPWPIIIERDCYWRPGPAREVIRDYDQYRN